MLRSSRAARFVLAGLLATLLALAFATPSFALTGATVTIDEETGGQPTRFTVVATTDADALTKSMDVVFPKGFDISRLVITGADPTKYDYDVVTLEGLVRVKNTPSATAEGETLKIAFSPAISPNSSLRIQIRNVETPIKGETHFLTLNYAAETTATGAPVTVQRSSKTTTFSYATPAVDEIISRWLDKQKAVKSWNDVKALGMFFKPQLIATSIPLLFTGWLLSIALVLCAFPIAIGGGLGVAFMKMSKVPPLRWIAAAYINVIRGTPLFLQIYVAFIGLRIAGFRASDFVTAVVVLAMNSSAYLAEIFRAGIQSINRGQFEAASSLGMTYWQSMRYVIIPQTVKRVLPTMTSEFILLFKDTALLSAIGVFELMMFANNYVARVANLTPFVVAACFYLIVTIPLINLVGRLEAKLAQSEHGQSAPTPKKPRSGIFGRWAPSSAGAETDYQASVAVTETRWRP